MTTASGSSHEHTTALDGRGRGRTAPPRCSRGADRVSGPLSVGWLAPPAIDDLALFSIIDTEIDEEGSGVVLTTSVDQAMVDDAYVLLAQHGLIREGDLRAAPHSTPASS